MQKWSKNIRNTFLSLQIIRTSYRTHHYDQLVQLMDKLRQQLPRRPTAHCLRFVSVADGLHMHDPTTIENVLQRMPGDIKSFSVFDFADICKALVMFDYKSPGGHDHIVLPMILQEIRERTSDLRRAFKIFNSLVYYLAVLGYHDNEIIENALRSDFLTIVYGRPQVLDSVISGLSAYAEINLRQSYRGALLDHPYKKKLKRPMAAGIKEQTKVYSGNRMLKTMMEVFDDTAVPYRVGYALPHFESAGESWTIMSECSLLTYSFPSISDLYLMIDRSTGKFVDPEREFPQPITGINVSKADFIPNDTNAEVIAVVTSYWEDYCRLKGTPNLLLQLKLEQLKLLGYHPMLVSFYLLLLIYANILK